MKYFELLLFMGAIAVLNSCCQMKDCNGVEDINAINLLHFKKSDLDSTMIVTYEKNSDFCTSIDTFKMLEYYYEEMDSTGILLMKERLNPNFDYKVIMPRINQFYELTEFVLKKQECNYCFPTGHDHYSILDSYKVNGHKKINGGFNLQINSRTDQ